MPTSSTSARQRSKLRFVVAVSTFVVIAAVVAWRLSTAAPAADLTATPDTLSSVFAKAAPGDVIHLAAGEYGQFTGGRGASSLTLTAAPGVTATIELSLSGMQNLRFDGLTVDGAYLNGASNVAIVNSRFTGALRIDTPLSVGNANVLIDHDSFANIDVCSSCVEGRLAVRGYDNKSPVGVTISNNTFGPGGNADGIQIIGDAYGVQIGPGNEFTGLAQGSEANAPHTDPIQLYGSQHTLITGNWLHNNATGIMAPDESDHETITQNVIQTTGYPWAVILGGADGDVVNHNTFPGSGALGVGNANNGTPSTGVVATDNVLNGIVSSTGGTLTGVTQDYNLSTGRKVGAHDISGRPNFAGGANPSTYAGYLLASSSLGVNKADDGTNVGITASVGVGASPPVTPPPSKSSPTAAGSTSPAADPAVSVSAAALAAAAALHLTLPKPGAHFTNRLRAAAAAEARAGVRRVSFWLGPKRLATDHAKPYRANRRVPARTRYGKNTLTVRFFDAARPVGSVAVVIRRVRAHARLHSGDPRVAWRIVTVSAPTATTVLGQGPPHGRVRVRLARCRDGARVARVLRLTASRTGRVTARPAMTGLCVMDVAP